MIIYIINQTYHCATIIEINFVLFMAKFSSFLYLIKKYIILYFLKNIFYEIEINKYINLNYIINKNN